MKADSRKQKADMKGRLSEEFRERTKRYAARVIRLFVKLSKGQRLDRCFQRFSILAFAVSVPISAFCFQLSAFQPVVCGPVARCP